MPALAWMKSFWSAQSVRTLSMNQKENFLKNSKCQIWTKEFFFKFKIIFLESFSVHFMKKLFLAAKFSNFVLPKIFSGHFNKNLILASTENFQLKLFWKFPKSKFEIFYKCWNFMLKPKKSVFLKWTEKDSRQKKVKTSMSKFEIFLKYFFCLESFQVILARILFWPQQKMVN